MKVTQYEERDFGDLDSEEQVEYIKAEITEFTGRVVVAVGIAIGGIWYGSNTKPHSYASEYSGEVIQVTTSSIVFWTLAILGVSAYVGFSAYKRRERILNAIRATQNGGDDA
ncbi:hypothetical protein [Haloarchaeobius baliensis]|uniref:hypothetical protein n=1 Tax=Haloarchaeobius baliensis TaxID=1670458 RepID=UPI003F884F31